MTWENHVYYFGLWGRDRFRTVAEKYKTNPDSENKITNYKRKSKKNKQIRKHNNNSENIITSQKTQWQIRKQNNKSENTTTNLKTKQQFRKHNDNSDKPEKVCIVWGSAIGLGIDDSPLTGRDSCQSRCTYKV